MKTFVLVAGLAGLFMLTACGERKKTDDSATRPDTASALGGYDTPPTPEQLEAARRDDSWKRFVELDSIPVMERIPNPETWDSITPDLVNNGTMFLPLEDESEGPSVLRTQILLDRIRFSPGMIDGTWGQNTATAIYWLQKREGIRATGQVDTTTFRVLMQYAGSPDQLIVAYTLTAADVNEPFLPIPEDIYEKAEMKNLGYESLTEKLSEMFHITPRLIEKLNTGKTIGELKAGDRIYVPNVREVNELVGGIVKRLEISDGGHYVHAVDSTGRILYHLPSTLGSTYDPSPTGNLSVVSVTKDPWWHYQPDILAHVPDSEKDARIPPGPNNSVGLVWMALSEPHYGIHGTSSPETIGYATSAGCVRLTNWDALFLADRIHNDIPVHFRDTV